MGSLSGLTFVPLPPTHHSSELLKPDDVRLIYCLIIHSKHMFVSASKIGGCYVFSGVVCLSVC